MAHVSPAALSLLEGFECGHAVIDPCGRKEALTLVRRASPLRADFRDLVAAQTMRTSQAFQAYLAFLLESKITPRSAES
jgi:hypothetical protein